jgi:Cys-rich protein (TIGR01571 family)
MCMCMQYVRVLTQYATREGTGLREKKDCCYLLSLLLQGCARSNLQNCFARFSRWPRTMAEAQWQTGICHCHIVKDCGTACCCQTCLGLPCIFGAAMERAGLGGCFPWCSALNCCPCCTGCNARAKVAEKYGIKEGGSMSCIYACCCPGCSELQIINQVRFSPMPNHLKSFHFASRCPSLWSSLAYFTHHPPHSPHPRSLCS